MPDNDKTAVAEIVFPEDNCDLNELISEQERIVYQKKRSKKNQKLIKSLSAVITVLAFALAYILYYLLEYFISYLRR